MKWLRSAESAAALVAALIVAALFAVLIAGVCARYGLGHPLAWTDEVAAMLFVWLVFWTGAFVLKVEEHVAFDVVYDLAPPAMRRVLGALGAACAAALLFWALPKVADYVAFLWRERTPVLQWRQDFLYACFPAFVAMFDTPLNSLTRIFREFPTVSGETCSYVDTSFCTACTCIPPLCANALVPTYGCPGTRL